MRWDILETATVSKLKAYGPLVGIVNADNIFPLPETEDMFTEFERGFVNSKVCVAFGAGECMVNRDTNNSIQSLRVVSQKEDVTIDIMIAVKTARGDNGAYAIMDNVKKALIGYKHPDMRERMYLVNEGLIERRKAIYYYQVKFASSVNIVEDANVNAPITITDPAQLTGVDGVTGPPLTTPIIQEGEIITELNLVSIP